MKWKYGMVRVATVSPRIRLANPHHNAQACLRFVNDNRDIDLFVFPELCITGYTCGDLFHNRDLLLDTQAALKCLTDGLKKIDYHGLIIVGAPVCHGNALYNCGIVMCQGHILGVIPKQHLPNYKEFYEARWFARPRHSSQDEVTFATQNWVRVGGQSVQFSTNLLIDFHGVKIGVEVCEDLWMPVPPSCIQAQQGALILCNLSASNDLVTKGDYRRSLVANQSARCIAGYLYASAGAGESTADVVYGGHCLIAENGSILAESPTVGDYIVPPDYIWVRSEIDVEKLANDRRRTTTFEVNNRSEKPNVLASTFLHHNGVKRPELERLHRTVEANPFIPSTINELQRRCSEIIGIQAAGLAHRLQHAQVKKAVIGVSGGLDSTLALLVTCMAFDALKLDRTAIHGYTMPGFGTTKRTKNNAVELMTVLGITQHEVDIRESCMQTFRDMKYSPFGIELVPDHKDFGTHFLSVRDFEEELLRLPKGQKDLKFENVQARARTNLLMNSGFVIGTGDMSELALGWCTFNGDHMSMYNPNCGVPKTLVGFLVEYVAKNLDKFHRMNVLKADPERLSAVLLDIWGTPISPELLPIKGEDGGNSQKTEEEVGPYELADFFLYHTVRNGFSRDKILWLASQSTHHAKYGDKVIGKWYDLFHSRFYRSQFKRNAVPDGPKVGTISLSPRGDWRMPSDAEPIEGETI